MQVHPVKLPSGPLILCWHFCRIIAQAIYPKKKAFKDLKGIECVSDNKIYPLDVLPTGLHFPLDETDRQAIAKILPELPELDYPMSEEKAAAFMAAYTNLPNRPIWMPVLEAEETIFARKIEHDTIMGNHIQELCKEHRAGRLLRGKRLEWSELQPYVASA